jgi:hypothetical protein
MAFSFLEIATLPCAHGPRPARSPGRKAIPVPRRPRYGPRVRELGKAHASASNERPQRVAAWSLEAHASVALLRSTHRCGPPLTEERYKAKRLGRGRAAGESPHPLSTCVGVLGSGSSGMSPALPPLWAPCGADPSSCAAVTFVVVLVSTFACASWGDIAAEEGRRDRSRSPTSSFSNPCTFFPSTAGLKSFRRKQRGGRGS